MGFLGLSPWVISPNNQANTWSATIRGKDTGNAPQEEKGDKHNKLESTAKTQIPTPDPTVGRQPKKNGEKFLHWQRLGLTEEKHENGGPRRRQVASLARDKAQNTAQRTSVPLTLMSSSDVGKNDRGADQGPDSRGQGQGKR